MLSASISVVFSGAPPVKARFWSNILNEFEIVNDDYDFELEDDDEEEEIVDDDDDFEIEDDDEEEEIVDDDDDFELEEDDDIELDDDDEIELDEEDDDIELDDDDEIELDEEDDDIELDDDDEIELDEEDDDIELDDDDEIELDEEDDDIELDDDNEEDDDILNLDDEEDDDDMLNLDDEEEDDDILNLDEDDDNLNFDDEQDEELKIDDTVSGIKNKNYIPNYDISKQLNEIDDDVKIEDKNEISIINKTEDIALTETNLKINEGQRIIAFVGAHGNGTSFIINNMAQLLSEQGIKTAILDLTKNKNSYYIYTENEENLRSIAYSCFEKLESGISDGIKVSKNLTVYTSLPTTDNDIENKEMAINTLLNNYSLILLDCDFDTDFEYFKLAQELYLVQSFDILTIQPITSFVKKLKMNSIVNEEKFKIIINKSLYVSGINERTIVAAMSVYNSPDTTYQLDLFDRNKVEYFEIPFEEKNYSKYLDELVKCKLTLRGYTKGLLNSFNKLAKSIYPINKKKKSK